MIVHVGQGVVAAFLQHVACRVTDNGCRLQGASGVQLGREGIRRQGFHVLCADGQRTAHGGNRVGVRVGSLDADGVGAGGFAGIAGQGVVDGVAVQQALDRCGQRRVRSAVALCLAVRTDSHRALVHTQLHALYQRAVVPEVVLRVGGGEGQGERLRADRLHCGILLPGEGAQVGAAALQLALGELLSIGQLACRGPLDGRSL